VDKFLAAIGIAFLMALLICVMAPLAALGGALTGYIVQWLMPTTTLEILALFGLTLPLWKIGAALGFVGAFFRSSNTNQKA